MAGPLLGALVRAASAQMAQGGLSRAAAAAGKSPYRAAASGRGGMTLTEATDGANNVRDFRRIIDGARDAQKLTRDQRSKQLRAAAEHANQAARERARQVKWAGNARHGELAKLADAAKEAKRLPAMGSPFSKDWEREKQEKRDAWEAKKQQVEAFVKKIPGGKILAFGLALALATKKIKDFGEAAVERNKHLARFDPTHMGAQMGLERARLTRDVRMAANTRQSTRQLSQAVQALMKESEPLQSMFTNATNQVLTLLTQIARAVTKGTSAARSGAEKLFTAVTGFGVRFGSGDARPDPMPTTTQLRHMGRLDEPRNRRPAGRDAP